MDALFLARVQFGFTISFHILFPALTIGLAGYLAVHEGLWLRSRRQVYMDLYHFWLKVFSVARSEEHTSELQSLMRISYAVFCLKKKKRQNKHKSKNNNK